MAVPPPLSFPTPCVPRGGGGASLGQPKIFCCGSLCCCVGDCVVGHCHLYPLYSWQDILLTFAEMELDSTTMFPPGTNVMFIRSTGNLFWCRSLDIWSTVMHIAASLMSAMARLSCSTVRLFGASQMCVYGGGAVPQGGLGDRHLATIPQGVVGDRLPWVGNDKGGGVLNLSIHDLSCTQSPPAPCRFEDMRKNMRKNRLEEGAARGKGAAAGRSGVCAAIQMLQIERHFCSANV